MLDSGLVKKLGLMIGFKEVSVEFPIPLIGNWREWQQRHSSRVEVDGVLAAGEAVSKAVKVELETTLGPSTTEFLDRADHWAAICRLTFNPQDYISSVLHRNQKFSE